MTKAEKAIIDQYKAKLASDPRWALRGLVRIYALQTVSEQCSGQTRELNGVGFSGVDGDILSSFAEQVNRGRTLSAKQMALLHKKMPRYAGQLRKIVLGEVAQ